MNYSMLNIGKYMGKHISKSRTISWRMSCSWPGNVPFDTSRYVYCSMSWSCSGSKCSSVYFSVCWTGSRYSRLRST